MRTCREPGKRIQIYVRKDVVGEKGFQLFHLLDLGDHIGVRGHLFRTKTGELSIWVEELVLSGEGAAAACRRSGMGCADIELRYRQRYLDLIAKREVARGVPDAGADHSGVAAIFRWRADISKWKRR